MVKNDWRPKLECVCWFQHHLPDVWQADLRIHTRLHLPLRLAVCLPPTSQFCNTLCALRRHYGIACIHYPDAVPTTTLPTAACYTVRVPTVRFWTAHPVTYSPPHAGGPAVLPHHHTHPPPVRYSPWLLWTVCLTCAPHTHTRHTTFSSLLLYARATHAAHACLRCAWTATTSLPLRLVAA